MSGRSSPTGGKGTLLIPWKCAVPGLFVVPQPGPSDPGGGPPGGGAGSLECVYGQAAAALAGVQLVGASSCAPKSCRFEPWSGRVWEATNQRFSLTSSPSLSLKSIIISLGEEQKHCWAASPALQQGG